MLRFIEKKSTIPILQNVSLTAGGGKLCLVGTNLEIAGMTSIPGESEVDETAWATTVPARLLKYLAQVKDDTVRLSPTITKSEPYKMKEPILDDKGKKIWDEKTKEFKEQEVEKFNESHKLCIRHGEDSEATFDGMSPSSFPEVPIPDKVYGELRGLKQAPHRAAVAISAEESRFTLNGVLLALVPDGQSALISTDGHRLSYLPINATALLKCETIVRRDALYEAARMNGDSCLFGMNDEFHLFLGPQRSIISRKLTGIFPDYHRVLPSEHWRSIAMQSETLAEVIQRVSVCADERSCFVHFYVDLASRRMTVKAEQCDQKAQGSVPIEWPDDTPWNAGLNWTYVADFLKLAPGAIRFQIPEIDPKVECVSRVMEFVTEDGWRMVIMPMRLCRCGCERSNVGAI